MRVRPFAGYEAGQECIITMEGQKCIIRNPSDDSEKEFLFPMCLWSHSNENGKKIYSNVDLFNDVGLELIGNAFEGFNATVFAYGQTGSGKSYSVEGRPPNDKGIL